MRTLEEIELLEQNARRDDPESRHALALCLKEDWLEVKGRAVLKYVFLTFYKTMYSDLSVACNAAFLRPLETFKNRPGVNVMRAALTELGKVAFALGDKYVALLKRSVTHAMEACSDAHREAAQKLLMPILRAEHCYKYDLSDAKSIKDFVGKIECFAKWIQEKDCDVALEAEKLLSKNINCGFVPSIAYYEQSGEKATKTFVFPNENGVLEHRYRFLRLVEYI